MGSLLEFILQHSGGKTWTTSHLSHPRTKTSGRTGNQHVWGGPRCCSVALHPKTELLSEAKSGKCPKVSKRPFRVPATVALSTSSVHHRPRLSPVPTHTHVRLRSRIHPLNQCYTAGDPLKITASPRTRTQDAVKPKAQIPQCTGSACLSNLWKDYIEEHWKKWQTVQNVTETPFEKNLSASKTRAHMAENTFILKTLPYGRWLIRCPRMRETEKTL